MNATTEIACASNAPHPPIPIASVKVPKHVSAVDIHAELRAGDLVIATYHRRHHLGRAPGGAVTVLRVSDLGGNERPGIGIIAYPDGDTLHLSAFCATPGAMPRALFWRGTAQAVTEN